MRSLPVEMRMTPMIHVRRASRSIAMALLVLSPLLAAVTAQGADPAQQREMRKRQMELARLPLHEAARQAGGTYEREMEVHRWGIVPDLHALAGLSALIIVGEIAAGVPVLSHDQTYVSTISTVRIVEAVKGEAPYGKVVRVVVPGGQLVFKDGTSATIRTPGLEPLRFAGQYVLFLEPIEKVMPAELITPSMRGSFVPVAGPQGVFALTSAGVQPQGRDVDELVRRHSNEPVDVFLRQVRSLR
jgi:hypothetical protein